MKHKHFILLGVLAILLVPGGLALAADACTGDAITGTVVDVDTETGIATIEDEDGIQCTTEITNADDYDHPITSLLAAYFNDANAEDLGDALDTLTVCAVEDPPGTWSTVEVAEGETCAGTYSGSEVTVTGQNEDGTFIGEGIAAPMTFEDKDTSGGFADALGALVVEWNLNEDGGVADAGDDIATYHDEEGIGFGVLVKVYAIAEESAAACAAEDEEAAEKGEDVDPDEPCGATVEEMVTMLEEGVGLGKLFQLFGKPAMLGVGHVRQAYNGDDGGGDDGDDKGDGEEECKSGGGHDMGTHTGHVDCVNVGGGGGGSGLPSGDKNGKDDDGDD